MQTASSNIQTQGTDPCSAKHAHKAFVYMLSWVKDFSPIITLHHYYQNVYTLCTLECENL